MGLAILPLLAIVVVILLVVFAVQRVMKKGDGAKSGGADIVAYLLLALAMGVTGFALVELANTAFPGDRFIFDPADTVATSVAAIVVAGPFLVYFWRRQADRRVEYPASAGWTLYLTAIELVFMTAFVVSAVFFVDQVLIERGVSGWASTIVFGAIVVFHELAARRTPPRSDGWELPRVTGSAIGLITAVIGLNGAIAALLTPLLSLSGPAELSPWLPMFLVGAPIWLYRWLPRWDGEPGPPRLVWMVVVSLVSYVGVVGTGSAIIVLTLQYLLGDTGTASDHFEALPQLLATGITALAAWLFHRRLLGSVRTTPLMSYEYGIAAIGLVSGVIAAIGLTVIAFDRSLLVGGGTNDVIGATVALVVGLMLWLIFSRRHERGDPGEEAAAWPRRLYNLGLGVLFGLAAAIALITTLFILLRRLLGDDGSSSLLIPFAVFIYTALAAWYLLAAYSRDREATASDEVITPFDVTIICGHPGLIATKFPPQARLSVIHRGDGLGVIDDEMAERIVAQVNNQSSIVWVDLDGFRIAPKLVPA